ncbi:hypothetical protein [Microbacterium sp. MRS-1]|uniref:hypothetical protein n=1 Tax=Microbacterium sp. MRS-1 TaxID=1451261 RepID=UPI00044DCA16|nr:hypothetical protein [Microbacterium sp. MRS-1]EXJ51489.1 hypothetical protein AS96_09260 [Microbacterium sp. MRS-1]
MERPTPNPERRDELSELEELLQTLPEPKEAGIFVTAMFSDKTQDVIFETQAAGQNIDPITARLIAYTLTAHAPDELETARLRRFFATGIGSHEHLKAEYLPLREHPAMEPEEHLLIDSLGTYLANREGDQPRQDRRARRMGQVLFALLTHADGHHDGLLFKTRAQVGELGAAALGLRLARLAHDHGEPFIAFLRAPAVDAAAPDIEALFRTAYIGEQDELDAVRKAPDSTHPVTWNTVEIGGRSYVFHG